MTATRVVAVDAMGGDHGVSVTVPASLQALQRDPTLEVLLVGQTAVLRPAVTVAPSELQSRLRLVEAPDVVGMGERPSSVLRARRRSSLWLALEAVQQGQAQACVSAGNTGAIMALGRHLLKTFAGVDRPAIVTQLPTSSGHCQILDLGANVDLTSDHLYQFAVMGSVLASAVGGVQSPTVGLLNIGEEAIKGREQIQVAAELMARSDWLNYVGYIEGDGIWSGAADVVVCDGFTGNVALKASEGLAKLIDERVALAFSANWRGRALGLLARPVLQSLRSQIDPGRYNGASFLGLQGIVVKSHGASGVDAFAHAVKTAAKEIEQNVAARINERLEALLV
ncbi:MAG: phosphate acyltransferase PlsX [Pseudomonadota bacterium]|nr:phosphate acyltransferase PlsX [Pseudomonadota bacterium]